MAIKRITEDNFKNIPAAMLVDSTWYTQVESLVREVGVSYSDPYAEEIGKILEQKITEIGKQMDAELFTKYIRLIKVLVFYSLRTMFDQEKELFFKEQLLDMFWLDFVDVKDRIDYILRAYYDAKDIQENFRKLFISGIEKNTQFLGFQNIGIMVSGEDRVVVPTIQNWLIDYNTSFHISSQTKSRGGFEHISYITRSPNALRLNKEQREVLLKVVEFYDWLKFDPLNYEVLLPGEKPVEGEAVDFKNPEKYLSDEVVNELKKFLDERGQTTREGMSYLSRQKFELPEEVLRPVQPVQKVQPPAVPTPKSQPPWPSPLPGRPPQNIALPPPLNSIGGENEKTARLRAVSQDLNQVTGSPNLTLKNSIAKSENLSSGGREGNRTPETQVSSLDSSPDHAHSKELYHTSAQNTPNRVNFQDILKDREQATDNRQQGDAAGLRMGDMAVKSDKLKVQSVEQLSNVPPLLNQSSNSGSGQASLPPSTFAKATVDKQGGGMGARSHPASFILNPLLEKKPVVPQSGQSRQAEIDRKLEELKKKAQGGIKN